MDGFVSSCSIFEKLVIPDPFSHTTGGVIAFPGNDAGYPPMSKSQTYDLTVADVLDA